MPIWNQKGVYLGNRPNVVLPVTSGLVSYLDAGDTASYPGTGTTWTDLVSSVNNGTLTNGPVFTSSGSASYFTFDGSNDGVQLAGTNFSLNTMTISCWNYAANYLQDGFMFEKTTNGSVNTQYSLFFTGPEASIYYRTFGLSTQDLILSRASSGLVNNQWNNIVATFDGTNKRIYVNGVLRATSSNLTGTVTQNTTGAAYIGIYGSFAGYPFNGRVAINRIFNRALSQAEITQDYNFFKGRYGLA